MSEWNVKSLKKHFDRRFKDIKEALRIALDSLNQRLAGMNEIREQLNTQAGTMATKEYVDANLKMLEGKIESLQKLVYIGIGGVLTLQIIITIVLAIWNK